MRPLPPAIMRAANRIDGDSPWLILLDIAIENEPMLRLVNNTEDVVFGGNTYVAFAFELEMPKEVSTGEIPSIKLSIANVTRSIQLYMEQYAGGVGSTVTITIVNAGLLAEDYAELTIEMTVMTCTCTAQWVSFTLSTVNPLNKKFPPDQYIASHCRFTFKGAHCAYVGATASCTKTLQFCQSLSNSARFGGHPGLDGRGLRLV